MYIIIYIFEHIFHVTRSLCLDLLHLLEHIITSTPPRTHNNFYIHFKSFNVVNCLYKYDGLCHIIVSLSLFGVGDGRIGWLSYSLFGVGDGRIGWVLDGCLTSSLTISNTYIEKRERWDNDFWLFG